MQFILLSNKHLWIALFVTLFCVGFIKVLNGENSHQYEKYSLKFSRFFRKRSQILLWWPKFATNIIIKFYLANSFTVLLRIISQNSDYRAREAEPEGLQAEPSQRDCKIESEDWGQWWEIHQHTGAAPWDLIC